MAPQVIIIGGGLGGPILALCLRKYGISSAIYELRPKTYEAGGNVVMSPNAARVLDHVGLYGRLFAKGFSYEEISFCNGRGEMLGKFLNGSQKHYNFHALRIRRLILHGELLKACEERQIPVYHDKKFKRIVSESAEDTTVEFEDGEEVTAEFIIGCDGIHSKVRGYIQEMHPTFSGLMGIGGLLMESELESLQKDTRPYFPTIMYGANGSFAVMPVSFDGKQLGYFSTIEAEDRSREDWDALYKDKQKLKQMLHDRFLDPKAHWPDFVQEMCEKTPLDSFASYPYYSIPRLDSWKSTHGRVIIIGDAAHAIPPTGGQGAAMAFEDAETLAYTMCRVYSILMVDSSNNPGDVISDQLTKWERHRQERIAKVLDFTTNNGTLRKASPSVYVQTAKEWMIWAIFKFIGSGAGTNWLYTYNAENVLGALV
ncbi:FAD-dependent monooxygenase nodY2-like protein [Cladobotryum mycophilum]|uniref:FAD-dependent monooxygenase nodY2-like protein n=1 Tax=Cladobotryum mycophilum TaxID=491253 RepID=A0ABR0SI60_9HYPO